MAVDTAPEQLRVSAGAGRLPAVAVHRVAAPPYRLELRILAASHQVVVEPTGSGGDDRDGDTTVRHVETVACRLVPSAAPLAHGAVYDHGGWRLAASVVRADAAGLAGEAEAWLARGRDDGRCVVVRFPNHPHALTALAVDAGPGGGTASGAGGGPGVGWTGVHLYPSPDGPGGTVVRTTTTRPVRPPTTAATAATATATPTTVGAPARAALHMRGVTEVHG